MLIHWIGNENANVVRKSSEKVLNNPESLFRTLVGKLEQNSKAHSIINRNCGQEANKTKYNSHIWVSHLLTWIEKPGGTEEPHVWIFDQQVL